MTRIVGMAALLYGARRYHRNWGTTKDESRMRLPGDELVRRPSVQSTEGVWIDAPAEAVWPWLVQIGEDRGGLYSFEILKKFVGLDYHDADRIHPEWQRLVPGDAIRLAPEHWMGLRRGVALKVEQMVENSALVLRGTPPDFPWLGVWSFHLDPGWEDRCRLLVRTRVQLRHPGEVLTVELAGPLVALTTRGLLLGIKRRAEHRLSSESADTRP